MPHCVGLVYDVCLHVGRLAGRPSMLLVMALCDGLPALYSLGHREALLCPSTVKGSLLKCTAAVITTQCHASTQDHPIHIVHVPP